jgi:rod shape-determining protein MreC
MLARFWDKFGDLLIFGILVVISLVVLLSEHNPLYRAARSVAIEVSGPVDGVYARAGRFTSALRDNTALRDEAINLSAEVARLRAARRENERLRALVGFRDTVDVQMVPARVVRKDITRQENLLTISAGSSDGVQEGMPVLDERGIIGRVILVSPNYSVVMPHQNTNFSVAAQISELGRDGVVRWDGQIFDRLVMEYVVKTEPVEPGMLVVTSTYSGNFPAGVPIGRVDSVFAAVGRNDLVIYLRPTAPLATVDFVYVMLQGLDPEQVELEATPIRTARRR